MGEVDSDFIQPLEHQSKPGIIETEGIPLIELSPLNSSESDTDALEHLVAEIGDACKNWEFASRQFFALSKEEKKKKVRRNEVNHSVILTLRLQECRDWKWIFDCTIENPTIIYALDEPDDKELKELTNQWPEYPPDLRTKKPSKSHGAQAEILDLQPSSSIFHADLNQHKSGKHFGLVHGSGHGAWCWYKLVPLLRSSGHNVTALDLAASGINPKQAIDVPFASEYFSPLIEFMASLPPQGKVILVGHSFGGFAITQAIEMFPHRISVAIFATAFTYQLTNFSILLQEATRIRGDTLDSTYTFDNGPNNPPTTLLFGRMYLATRLYQLSPIQDWTLATLLGRPFYLYTPDDLQRTLTLSSKNYGSVNRVFIISGQDTVIPKYFQQCMITENPPKEVREITGSDHMVMMSKPTELFDQLQDISQKYSSGEYMLK